MSYETDIKIVEFINNSNLSIQIKNLSTNKDVVIAIDEFLANFEQYRQLESKLNDCRNRLNSSFFYDTDKNIRLSNEIIGLSGLLDKFRNDTVYLLKMFNDIDFSDSKIQKIKYLFSTGNLKEAYNEIDIEPANIKFKDLLDKNFSKKYSEQFIKEKLEINSYEFLLKAQLYLLLNSSQSIIHYDFEKPLPTSAEAYNNYINYYDKSQFYLNSLEKSLNFVLNGIVSIKSTNIPEKILLYITKCIDFISLNGYSEYNGFQEKIKQMFITFLEFSRNKIDLISYTLFLIEYLKITADTEFNNEINSNIETIFNNIHPYPKEKVVKLLIELDKDKDAIKLIERHNLFPEFSTDKLGFLYLKLAIKNNNGKYFEKSIETLSTCDSDECKTQLARAFYLYSTNLFLNDDRSKSSLYIEKALNIHEKLIKTKPGIITEYIQFFANNVFIEYRQNIDLATSLKFLVHFETFIHNLTNMGLFLTEFELMERIKDAIYYYVENRNPNVKYILGEFYRILGDAFSAIHKYDVSMKYYDESISLYVENKKSLNLSDYSFYLSRVYLSRAILGFRQGHSVFSGTFIDGIIPDSPMHNIVLAKGYLEDISDSFLKEEISKRIHEVNKYFAKEVSKKARGYYTD